METQHTSNIRPLQIVRIALIMGPLSIGVLAVGVPALWAITPGLVDGVEGYVQGGFILFFLGLFGGILALRSKCRAAESFAEKRSSTILGWGLGESGGLLGALYMMFVGDPTFFGAGIALQFLASFVLLPMPEQ